jgi:FkbM family methyltransferase
MYYAQYGEDRILNQIFSGKTDGVCVEVGGFDGITGSNTYFFEKLGWRCLIVEPMTDFCEKIRKVRQCDVAEIAASDAAGEVQFHVAVGVETLSTIEKNEEHFARIRNLSADSIRTITVKTEPLDKILLDRSYDKVDFLTIDVEGHEMSVLSGMKFDKLTPRIIIIEDNTHGIDRHIDKFMQSKSYIRFKKTGCNVWYVNKDDELATRWSRASTEFPIVLYRLKLWIKPYAPAWMKRKAV